MIINCYSVLEDHDKTHCDLCSEKLKIPSWGWFNFFHTNAENGKDGETKYQTPFDLIMCLMCSSKISHNIISDMRNAAQDYKKAAEYIESMPIMPPTSSVKVNYIKNN